jgi:hypothetical protein
MYVLRIEHAVPDYTAWKRAFDSDPAGRQQSGVRRYQIARAIDDANYVTIDLEFSSRSEAEAMLTSLHNIWGYVDGKIIIGPKGRIVETVEIVEYSVN